MSKKRLLVLLVVVVFIFSSCPVYAATKATVTSKLSFNGTTATCYVSAYDYGKYIDITLELWHGSTLVDSWSKTGTTSVRINENCNVTSGYTYTLIVTGTIGGASINCTPVTKTCP